MCIHGALFYPGTKRQTGAFAAVASSPEQTSKEYSGHAKTGHLTNQVMELHAANCAVLEIERAVESENIIPGSRHVVVTDSLHVMNCMVKWIGVWERTGFMTKNKKRVQNREMIQQMRTACLKHNIDFEYAPRLEGQDLLAMNRAIQIASEAADAGSRIGCRKIRKPEQVVDLTN